MQELTRKEEQILLAVHFLREDAYLITIQQWIKKHTGKNYSMGTIYAPLNRLYLKGFLESNLEKREEVISKPVRYYKLSRTGYDSLLHLRKQSERMWQGFSGPVLSMEKEEK